MKEIIELTSADHVAIVSGYDLSNPATMAHVCEVLSVEPDDLEAAVGLTADGLSEASAIDTAPYRELFDQSLVSAIATAVAEPVHEGGISKPTTASTPTTSKPQTATKTKKPAKKRGRSGNKIITAFSHVPVGLENAVSVDSFSAKHDVSQAVLRQSKRFDTAGVGGIVKVKQDKESKILQIWREYPAPEAETEAVAVAEPQTPPTES